MTSRLGFPRRSLSALACGATLLGVSACGSSTPTQVSQALKSRLESTLEKIPLTAAEATEVTDCLVPTLKAHGITTLAAASTGSQPPWEKPAIDACVKQAGLTGSGNTGSGNTGSGNTASGNTASGTATQPAAASSSSGVTDTEPADAQACMRLRQAFVTFHADQSQTNEDDFVTAALPNGAMTQTLSNAFGTLSGDLGEAANGYEDPTARAAEQAVATGCAAAGVTMPSGFTG
jgi:hypothetical protein